jgi:hypothetical protein
MVVPAAEGVEPQFLLYGRFERAKGVGIGFSLHALGLTELQLIAPHGDGSLTITVKPEEPLPWLTLEAGQSISALANEGRYRLTVHRLGPTRWRFEATPVPGGPLPYAAFNDGVLDLSASSPMPPWDSVSVRLEAHSASSRFATDIRLESDVSLAR